VFKLILAEFRFHIKRLIGSVLAIVIGVCFVTGTLVFTGTLKQAFLQSFAQNDVGIDVAITTGQLRGFERQNNTALSQALYTALGQLPGVGQIYGLLTGPTVVLNRYNHPVGGSNQSIGISVPANNDFSWVQLTSGKYPINSNQAVLDSNTADVLNLRFGQSFQVIDHNGQVHSFKFVGIIKVSLLLSIRTPVVVGFSPQVAQAMTGATGYQEIDIKDKAGFSPQQVVNEAQPVVGSQGIVQTGAQKTANDEQVVVAQANAFGSALLAFGVIALLVSLMVIANTFRTIVSQRTRELALLRCIGAQKDQIFSLVVGQAVFLGLSGGIIGTVLGIGLSFGVTQVFKLRGITFAINSLVIPPSAIISGLIVGVVASLISSIYPARVSTKIPPLVAVNYQADLQMGKAINLKRLIYTIVIFIFSILFIVLGLKHFTSTSFVVIGGAGILLGLLILAPVAVGPMSGGLKPFFKFFMGLPGYLATLNARRNPVRIAITSAALTIGLTLATLFAVVASSLTASIANEIKANFPTNFVLTSGYRGILIPVSLAQKLRAYSGFSYVEEVRINRLTSTFTKPEIVVGMDSSVFSQYKITLYSGNLSMFRPGYVALTSSYAASQSLKAGSLVTVDGQSFKVAAVISASRFFGDIVMPLSTFSQLYPGIADSEILLNAAPKIPAAVAEKVILDDLKSYPLVELQNLATFEQRLTSNVNAVLAIFDALLGLALLISFVGIANTLTMSVAERVREIGLLRALGMTRNQVRLLLACEGALLSILGAVSGILLGILGAWGIVLALRSQGVTYFSIPFKIVVIYLVAVLFFGLLASIIPANSAGKIAPVEALRFE
jgi:putative ABC transport system permease protein